MNLLVWYRSLMRSVGATLVKLIATATSGLVSFTTNVIRPVKVTCEFFPVQEGTGDPSPNNVRPISGWTGCEISGAPKNILPKTLPSTAITGTFGTGSTSISSATNGRVFSIYVGKNRTFNYRRNSAVTLSFAFADEPLIARDGYMLYDAINCSNRNDETLYSGEHPYLVVFAATTNGYETAITNNQVRLVDVFDGQDYSYTDREDWSPIPINWQSEAGTVYGGTVTLNEDGSVDLVGDWEKVKLSNLSVVNFGTNNNGGAARFTLSRGAEGGDSAYKCPSLSDTISRQGTQYQGYDWNRIINELSSYSEAYAFNGTRLSVATRSAVGKTREEFLAIVGNWEIAYKLATPQTYHFDNIGQLKAFLGTNNIWHDMNGSITAEYWKKQ